MAVIFYPSEPRSPVNAADFARNGACHGSARQGIFRELPCQIQAAEIPGAELVRLQKSGTASCVRRANRCVDRIPREVLPVARSLTRK